MAKVNGSQLLGKALKQQGIARGSFVVCFIGWANLIPASVIAIHGEWLM